MPNHSRALVDLCGCFRGRFPEHVDWMSLLALANQTLTTPALMEFVSRFERQIPADVRLYVREIYERNLARNDRLATQLSETVLAINAQGVTPILLKGAAVLATTPRSRWGSRLMADLDIMVAENELGAALNGLRAIGYSVHFQTPSGAGKWYADLARPCDVGMVDLHQCAPGPDFYYRVAGPTVQHCKLKPVGQGFAYIPSTTYQALMLIVHDQFQDHDYWTGNIDLRHLLDLRDLTNSQDGIDWNQLASFAPSKLARNALESQLVTMFAMLGGDVPIRMRTRFIPRLQYMRRRAQAHFPLLRWALLPIAVLDYKNHRDGPGAEARRETTGRRWSLPKKDTLRFLLALSANHRSGKV